MTKILSALFAARRHRRFPIPDPIPLRPLTSPTPSAWTCWRSARPSTLPSLRTWAPFLQTPSAKCQLQSDSGASRRLTLLRFWEQDWKTFPTETDQFSVIRLGEISPLWQNFKRLWQYLNGLFSFGQKFELIWQNNICYWAKFHCCK